MTDPKGGYIKPDWMPLVLEICNYCSGANITFAYDEGHQNRYCYDCGDVVSVRFMSEREYQKYFIKESSHDHPAHSRA